MTSKTPFWSPLNVAWKWGSQHLEGYKIYPVSQHPLSVVLFLLCLIKTVILLRHLLSDLSYWEPERMLHHLPFILTHTFLTPVQKFFSQLLWLICFLYFVLLYTKMDLQNVMRLISPFFPKKTVKKHTVTELEFLSHLLLKPTFWTSGSSFFGKNKIYYYTIAE